MCLKLTIKIPERRHWHHSDIFIVNFEHSSVSIVKFAQIIAGWDGNGHNRNTFYLSQEGLKTKTHISI